MFLPDFPHATHQVLALPLAKPRISRANIMRHIYILVAVGVEMTVIARLMNLRHKRLLALMGGEPGTIPIVEVEPEEFNFDGNLHNDT